MIKEELLHGKRTRSGDQGSLIFHCKVARFLHYIWWWQIKPLILSWIWRVLRKTAMEILTPRSGTVFLLWSFSFVRPCQLEPVSALCSYPHFGAEQPRSDTTCSSLRHWVQRRPSNSSDLSDFWTLLIPVPQTYQQPKITGVECS